MAEMSQFEANYRLAAAKKDAADWKNKQAEIESSFTPEEKAELARLRGEEGVGETETTENQRTVKCPDCDGEDFVNLFKKNTKDLSALFGNVGGATRLVLENAGILSKSSNRKKSKESLFKKGCPTCKGKKTLPDKTDQTKQTQAASKKAQQIQEEVTQLEAELGSAGPGGNLYTLVVGDNMLEVGLGHNDSKSYKVIKEGSLDPGGLQIEEEAVMKVSTKTDAVVGTNPVATPGGHYTIKCSNKFTVRAGAQGIELNSEGPLTIRCGQTQFIGPEITIGSSVGRVSIEGKSTSIGGDTISLNPGAGGKGQVSCTGTFTTVGNMIAKGGAHIEGDLSCISMTMPGKTERSKHGSQDSMTTGAAVWQAQAAVQGLQDFIRTRTFRAGDASGLIFAPREQQNIAAEQKNILKKALPIEPQPTGYCTVLGGSSAGIHPIFNYPHHHPMPDGIHAHDSFVPNIKTTTGCKSVRSNAKQKELPAPVMANTSDPGSSLFSQAFELFKAVAAIRII